MIRSKDVNKEIANIEDGIKDSTDQNTILKYLVKAVTLILKVLRDVKTNQVLGLKKAGVELIKETRNEEKKETDK